MLSEPSRFQLRAIQEENELKDQNSKKFLEKALQRGTMIERRLLENNALTAKESAELVYALIDKKGDEANRRQDLVDKLYEAKKREIKKNEMLSKAKIKELSKAKSELLTKEKKILEEKALHQQLRGRGTDFLTEIELGNAPPLEAIKRNIKIDVKAVRRFRSKEEVLELGQVIAQYGDKRLQEMRHEFDRDRVRNGLDETWREDLRDFFATCNPESYQIAKIMMVLVLDKAFYGIDLKEQEYAKMRDRQSELQARNDRMEKEMKIIQHNTAVKQIKDDLLSMIIQEMALETVKENMYVSKRIDEKMIDIFVKSLKLERNSGTNSNDLMVLAQNLEDEKLAAAREALLNQFSEPDQEKFKKVDSIVIIERERPQNI